MKKAIKNFSSFVIILFLILISWLLTACGVMAAGANPSSAESTVSDAGTRHPVTVPVAESPAPAKAVTSPGFSAVAVYKKVYPEPARPLPPEPCGVVYKGYLLDYYEALYGPMGPVSLAFACRSLDIKMTCGASRDKKGKTRDDWAPETVTLERGGSRLVLKVSGNMDEYYEKQAYPTIPYKVYKDGREISLGSFFSYKGHIYAGSLEELLAALNIQYFALGGNTYVDSDKATEIRGRILGELETDLGNGEKADVRLIYNYDTGSRPSYSSIVLEAAGREGRYVNISDKGKRGRSAYYSWGMLTEYRVGKDHLLKVDLSDASTDGKIDSAIYRISGNRIQLVYSTGFGDYSGSGCTIETDGDGNATFRDPANSVNKPLQIKPGKPDTIFTAQVLNTYMDVDDSSGECTLTVLEGIYCDRPLLYMSSVYKYNGGYFASVKNMLSDTYMPRGNTASPLFEYGTAHDSVAVVQDWQETGRLSEITVENMNDKNNGAVLLKLPDGWYAIGSIGPLAENFKFELDKNKSITKAWSYQLYNTNIRTDFYQYGVFDNSGAFGLPSYYRDQRNNILMRNHAWIKEKVWSGETVLGKGDIYIVGCDLPKEKRTESVATYDEIYAFIPVEGEQLAYNLAIDVPVGENTEDYLKIMKKILRTP